MAPVLVLEIEDHHSVLIALLANQTVNLYGTSNFDIRQALDVSGNSSILLSSKLNDGSSNSKNKNRYDSGAGAMIMDNTNDDVPAFLFYENKKLPRLTHKIKGTINSNYDNDDDDNNGEQVGDIDNKMQETGKGKEKRKENRIDVDVDTDANHYPYLLQIGSRNKLHTWKLTTDSDSIADSESGNGDGDGDGDSGANKVGRAKTILEDIVCALCNETFNIIVTVYTMGTVKLFSVIDGTPLRSFNVGKIDNFGRLDTNLLPIDPNTGLIANLVKNACFDCTQRRLVIVYYNDEIKFFNFFAGQEIDEFQPILPAIAINASGSHNKDHLNKISKNKNKIKNYDANGNIMNMNEGGVSIIESAGASQENYKQPKTLKEIIATEAAEAEANAKGKDMVIGKGTATGAGEKNLPIVNGATFSKKSEPFNALADAQAALDEEKAAAAAAAAKPTTATTTTTPTSASTRACQSIITSQFRNVTGIEKIGRQKFLRKMAFFGMNGGTVTGHLDKDGFMVPDASSVFRWRKKPWDWDLKHGRKLTREDTIQAMKESMKSSSISPSMKWFVYMDYKNNNMSGKCIVVYCIIL